MSLLRPSLGKQTTITSGTGALVLVANAGETRSLQQCLGAGPVKSRFMLRGNGYFEQFLGTFTAPSTLTRDSVISSSNSDNPVSIPGGTTTDVYLLDYWQFLIDRFSGNKTLANVDASNSWVFTGSSAANLTLAGISAAIPDYWGFVKNAGSAVLTLVAAGSDTIESGGTAAASIAVYPGQSGFLYLDATGAIWRLALDAFGVAPNTNKIINGDMVIDQRNAGASVTPTTNAYTLDRWGVGTNLSSKCSVQQNAGAVTPPKGFSYYIGITSLSAYAVASGDVFNLAQPIEGLNCTDLNWGTANAKPVTVSFWAYSSLTGPFGGAVRNSANNRSYPFTYTINQANTWEFKTVLIPGDTTGTWLTTTGVGISLDFAIGVGTTLSGAAGAWAAANYVSATGAVNVLGTNGAKLYLTGVKLEVGNVATPFVPDDYQVSLAKCKRYFQKFGSSTLNTSLAQTWAESATLLEGTVLGMMPMRAIPTLTTSGTFFSYNSGVGYGAAPVLSPYASKENPQIEATPTGSNWSIGQAGMLLQNSTTDTLSFSAEL